MSTTKPISHDRRDESIEAKARWFQSLSLPERMELLCEFTDLGIPGTSMSKPVKSAFDELRL